MTYAAELAPPTPDTPQPYSADDFDGYHAAPLLIVGGESNPDLIREQDRLARQFVRAVHGELEPHASIGVRNFVANSIITRMHQREGLNGLSYNQRRNRKPLLKIPGYSPEEVSEASIEAKMGRGTVLQNNLARIAFGMDSSEFANLTIIGEFRKNMERPMWDEVSELVDSDATPKPHQMYGQQVLGFDRDIRSGNHIGAMRIKMKRHVATLDDGTEVKARTTAIVNMSTSTGIDRELLSDITDAVRENKTEDGREQTEFQRLQNVAALPQFQRAVSWLIEHEVPEGLVLARNETVYGVSKPR